MKTQSDVLIRIGEVLEVTATIPMTRAASCGLVSRSLRVTAIFPWTVVSNQARGFHSRLLMQQSGGVR
jgi:hypothetical protein